MGKARYIGTVFAGGLFCLFTVCALLLSVLGANTYKKQTAASQAGACIRTSVLYISEKLRQADVAGAVSLSSVEGRDALVLSGEEDGFAFETWIFASGGQLCEAVTTPGVAVSAEMAQRILALDELDLCQYESGLVTFRVASGEASYSSAVMPRCSLKEVG